nr:MAG TPA: hypothetical protein [Caudoviricetes sp.]
MYPLLFSIPFSLQIFISKNSHQCPKTSLVQFTEILIWFKAFFFYLCLT